MSEQGAIALAERMNDDPAFRERIFAAPDGAARQAIANEAGYDVDTADYPAFAAALKTDELSEDELNRVTGHGTAGGTSAHVTNQNDTCVMATAP